jgi:hypothetical protein
MNGPPKDPEWISRKRTQELTGLGRAQVDNLRRSGRLVSVRNPLTNRVSVSMESVRELLRLRAEREPADADREGPEDR